MSTRTRSHHLYAPGRTAIMAGVVLLLVAAPAAAVVTVSTVDTTARITSDGASDAMNVTCTGGQVRVAGQNVRPCSTTTEIVVQGDAGDDTVNLSALTRADMAALEGSVITTGTGADTVIGSFGPEVVFAGSDDTVQGLGGNDFIVGAEIANGGEGHDTLSRIQAAVDAGPGDDRIVDPGIGPFDGGPGEDTLALDFFTFMAGQGGEVRLVITNTSLGASSEAAPFTEFPAVNLERYEVVLLDSGPQSWDSSAFSGVADVDGRGGVDTLVGGAAPDLLTGGADNDSLTGNGGLDILRGGPGDDTINSRDDSIDRVDCGEGLDSVVADRLDVLVGCETADVPPVPPVPPALPTPAPPVAPDTGAIKGKKVVTKGKKVKFTFASAAAGATFECKVDKGKWKKCTSPFKVSTKRLKASKRGKKHTLRVRAVAGGLVDATPSKRKFKVRTRR